MTYHIHRIYSEETGLEGAQILNEIKTDQKALNTGDHYILNGKAYRVEAATGLNFSGMLAFMYIFIFDEDLTNFFKQIGVL